MNSIKFKTQIDNISNVVFAADNVTVEIKKLDNEYCQIELNSFINEEEKDYLALMNAMAAIVESIGKDNITFIY